MTLYGALDAPIRVGPRSLTHSVLIDSLNRQSGRPQTRNLIPLVSVDHHGHTPTQVAAPVILAQVVLEVVLAQILVHLRTVQCIERKDTKL